MSLTPMIGAALKVPLFHGLEPNQMTELVRRAERVAYETGDALIENGDMGDAAILVITGRATQFNPFSSTRPYDPVEPGSLVGEMAMLVETTHHLTVVADEPIKALKFHRSMIEALMAEDPRLADHFVSRIAARLSDLAAEMRATFTAPSATAAAEPHIEDIPGARGPTSDDRSPASGQTFQGTRTGGTVETPAFPLH